MHSWIHSFDDSEFLSDSKHTPQQGGCLTMIYSSELGGVVSWLHLFRRNTHSSAPCVNDPRPQKGEMPGMACFYAKQRNSLSLNHSGGQASHFARLCFFFRLSNLSANHDKTALKRQRSNGTSESCIFQSGTTWHGSRNGA